MKMDIDIFESFSIELAELEKGMSFPVFLRPLDCWIILSQLQLALRHPKNTGLTAVRAKELALQFQEIVANKGALKRMAELGWISEFDK